MGPALYDHSDCCYLALLRVRSAHCRAGNLSDGATIICDLHDRSRKVFVIQQDKKSIKIY